VVVIEHNLEVIKTADWIIDPRPRRRHADKFTQPAHEKAGGEIAAQGTPEDIVKAQRSTIADSSRLVIAL